MKKFLPILFLFLSLSFLLPQKPAHAQQQLQQNNQVPSGSWVIDPEVTFIGKNAARSGNLLDFILRNYNWVCVKQVSPTQCDNSNNPLASVWLTTVTFIVVPLLFVIIIATAIIIIVSRGRSLTIMRFLPRFIAVILLIFFSFPLLQFFYQFIDVIQGFFLRSKLAPCPPDCISQKDLLYVGWDYRSFIGLRLLGDQYSESAFISLLLTKLTALTYYVMVGILVLRKIILWLFIIVSPIFPLLLLYYPIRNTGKIWVGEFFRWLLYAPLFAIFLKGLVSLWRNQIPLVFSNPDIGNASAIVYPTAVNILLGGPKQYVTPTNSVNLTETFALYVVSLLMLWGVIILPWILLQIFLDYASNIGVGDSAVMKTLVNKISSIQGPPGSPHSPATGGSALSLPFAKKFNIPVAPTGTTGMAREIPRGVTESRSVQNAYMPTAQVKAQVLNLANVPLPTMRDIAKYDTSLLSKDKDRQKETTIIRDNLLKIGNPSSSTSESEKERFTEIREKLVSESKSGNVLATNILNAANIANKRSMQASTNQIKSVLTQIANPSSATSSHAATTINKEKVAQMNQSLVKAKSQGNALAASILSVNDKTSTMEIEKLQERIMDAKLKGEPIAGQVAELTAKQRASLPAVNRVQTVSKEDYEAVKQMWKENYKNLEVPEGMVGTRTEWIKADMVKIEEIINSLSSKDEEQVTKGMQEVSSILPFLLVGGFSQAEILSYLKAKLDAAKDVAAEIVQDEDDKVTVNVKKTATATQTLSAALPDNTSDAVDTDDSVLSDLSSGSSTTGVGVGGKSQSSDEILNISNLKLPKLSDIVSYEVRHLTKDKTESERIDKIQQVLERISKPEKITSPQEREQYEKLKEKLTQERENGNQTADIILSAVNQLSRAASDIDLTLSEIKVVLTQIVNPQSVASSDDRDYYTRLHEYLEKESKEKNNQLAAKILKVNESTRTEELQDIKEQLAVRSQDSSLILPQVTVAMNDIAKARQLKAAIKEIMSLSEVSDQDNRVFKELKETLKTESTKGNSVASSVLSLNANSTDAELRSVHENLTAAGEAGNSVASSVLALYSASGTDVIEEKDISIEDTKTMLKLISNPQAAATDADRDYYSELQGYVKAENAGSNNVLAQKILTVNDATGVQEVQEIKDHLFSSVQGQASVLPKVTQALSEYVQLRRLKEVASRMSDTSSTSSAVKGGKVTELKNLIVEEDKKGNSLATSLLSINDSTTDATLRQIHITLKEAVKKGDPLAKSVVSRMSKQFDFTPANRLQKVTDEDYKEAFELWKKAYKQYFVPQGFTEDLKGRMDWINSDIADITETISLINSSDPDEKEKGMNKVSGILPFLLLGGFSIDEIQKYLKTKLDAANAALKELVENDENSVSVPVNNIETKPKTMEATEEIKENK